MIDWITAIIPCTHDGRVNGGEIFSICGKTGEVDWSCFKRLKVEGTHDSRIHVKTWDQNQLWISGNPSKFLQGHNVFGTNDLLGLCNEFFKQVVERLGLSASQGDLSAWVTGNFELKTVDCTESFQLPKQDDVSAWLRAAAPIVRGKHQAASAYSGETLYLGQNSRRISLKIYSKHLELLKNKLPKTLPKKDEIITHAKGLLRVEVRLHSMELKRRRLDKGSDWTRMGLPFEIVKERVMNMKLNQKFRLSTKQLDDLPPRLSLVYSAWTRGDDVRAIIPKSSFYRYRSELLELVLISLHHLRKPARLSLCSIT